MIPLLLLSVGLASGALLPVDSAVVEVTAFPDQARVVREVEVDVPAGRTELLFEGLPIYLTRESLSAAGEGTAGAVLTGLQVRASRGIVDRDARIAALQAERLGFTDRIAALESENQALAWEQALLLGIHPTGPAQLDKPLFLADDAPDQLAGITKMVGRDTLALKARQREGERKIRDLRQELSRVDRSLAELTSPGGSDNLSVAVGLDAKRAGKVRVRLSYLSPGVSWSPSYNARYDMQSGMVHLDLVGQVRQQTGEDWEDVALTLSTASPRQEIAPPVLQPYYLESGAGAYYSAPTQDLVTSWEFTARRPEDVSSDGTVRRVFLEELDLKAKVVHEVVARRDQSAWLTARVDYDGEYSLPAGPLYSYLGTAYVGAGQLAPARPGSELVLSFGVDDRVSVKRVRLEDLSEGTRPLGNKERRRWGYRTTVKNRTGAEIDLRVVDQIPASNEAVWEVAPTLTPEVEVPTTGVFTWEAVVPAGADQDFTLEYEITWPQGDQPIFLD
ncbi:MAG: DUF4139 domain-containing protein [Deltaproteobacteria bacterium]|nr:DUF4139 domain-containing protein [Deltaproteobacteria bacterium]